MKKLLLLLSSLLVGMHCFAGGILSGPWVADVREDRLTVVWTTAEPSTAFVELKDGTTLWETFAGRRVFGRLHKVRITGLTPGEVLHYRVGGIPVVDDTNPRDPTFGDPFAGPWHSTRTFDSAKETCRFSVFNDIHMRTEQFAALAGQVEALLSRNKAQRHLRGGEATRLKYQRLKAQLPNRPECAILKKKP